MKATAGLLGLEVNRRRGCSLTRESEVSSFILFSLSPFASLPSLCSFFFSPFTKLAHLFRLRGQRTHGHGPAERSGRARLGFLRGLEAGILEDAGSEESVLGWFGCSIKFESYKPRLQ